jgi:hypothetical protein
MTAHALLSTPDPNEELCAVIDRGYSYSVAAAIFFLLH